MVPSERYLFCPPRQRQHKAINRSGGIGMRCRQIRLLGKCGFRSTLAQEHSAAPLLALAGQILSRYARLVSRGCERKTKWGWGVSPNRSGHLRRRVIALVVSYVVALSAVFGSFGAARAAALTATIPGGVICHTLAADQTSSTDQNDAGKACADCCCCVGCLTAMAVLPPPPANAVALIQESVRIAPPPAPTAFSGDTTAKSHRSRAPPLMA